MAAGHQPPEASLQPVSLCKGQSSSYEEWEDQKKEHQQPVAQRGVFVIVGRATVHTAPVAFGVTVRGGPSCFTVAVPVVVAHPMPMALLLHVTVIVQDRGTHTLEVPADLSITTLGTFIHHPWVRDIRAQLEIHPPA